MAGIRFLAAGEPEPAEAWAMSRPDMPYRRSGFWGIVAVRGKRPGERMELEAEVRLRSGGSHRASLGQIPISPRPQGRPRSAARRETVAICMGTFDPNPRLLAAQIESIRAQTDDSWRCVISDDHSSPERFEQLRAIVGDDPRFAISRSDRRIGFYRNFERALRLAPAEAELIALCDQDDVWRPEKLSVLREALGPAMLVYSDLRLVDERGRVLRETLWRGRANNRTNLASLLIANTVTGAASLFRREVAEAALPFPDSPGLEFHDHWIALVALAAGELAYVDRPLYDYVQHSGAILGKVVAAGERSPSRPQRSRRALMGRRGRMERWRAAYFLGYVPGQVRARTLLLRCGERLDPGKRRALERYVDSSSSLLSFVWLTLRPLRGLLGRTETLGAEWELVPGIVWRHLAAWSALLPARLALDSRFPDPAHFEHRRLRRWRERV